MDPSLAFQRAIATRLLSTAAVTAIVGQRVLAPQDAQGATYPFVEIGEGQFVPEDGGCAPAGEQYETIHVWASGQGGSLKAKELASAVRAALAPPPPTYAPKLTLAGVNISSAVCESVRHLSDGDATDAKGLVAHSVLTFRFRVQAAA